MRRAWVLLLITGCTSQRRPAHEHVSAEQAADAVAQVVMAHRLAYAKALEKEMNARRAVDGGAPSDLTLPLPAELLRLAAEHVAETSAGKTASFELVSPYAINRVNRPRSAFEKAGLAALTEHPEVPFRGNQTLDGHRYLSSMYADRAVTRACVDCHNAHPDSPKHDFKLRDLMGALVVSITVEDSP